MKHLCKKAFYFISFLVLSCLLSLPLNAFEPKYTMHTSQKDINFKKEKSIKWYEDNLTNNKFYFYDANKHINFLKNRALKWYENNITKGKYYFVHSDKEIEFTKKKALRWHERNSQ